MSRFLAVAAFLILAMTSLAQPPGQNAVPDCQFAFAFTAAGNTPAFDNRSAGCVTWTVVYYSTGFTALSMTFQSANGPVTAGAFGAFAGAGAPNPMTNTTGLVTIFTNGTTSTPWLRVNMAGLMGSGTIRGVVLGWRTGSTGGSAGGACPNPCPVVGTADNGAAKSGDPVLTAVWDGANVRIPTYCPNVAAISFSASGNVQVVAASGSSKIYICHILFSTTAITNIQWTEGTGVNCAMGGANIGGSFQNVVSFGADPQSVAPIHTATGGDALCINPSANVTGGGWLTYAYAP